ncbi:MAG TPA: hypothetical protein VFH80_32130 [Solirubrobacteraceae bacterium]|nr:hypothetical protein [Solirubrobacteraceae bacterium]
MTKRVIECNICGEPLSAATDDELVSQVQRHYASEHPDSGVGDEQVREMVSSEAYEAGDA